jgi:hypothetical protein
VNAAFFSFFGEMTAMPSISIPTNLPNTPTLQVTAQSELMKNYQAALPASPEQELFAVHDSELRPIVFSFSPDGRFYAIVHRDDSPTGWAQIDLSAGLASFGVPTTFGAGQLPGGNVFVVVGVRDKGDPSKSTLLLAGPLSPDPKVTDWEKLAGVWSALPVTSAGASIEKILVGPVDDGGGYGIPTVAVSLKGAAEGDVTTFLARAHVDANSGAIAWAWVDFPTPTVKAALKDLGAALLERADPAAIEPLPAT